MGDNVFTQKDKHDKPDPASVAFQEAQKRLAETHLSLTTASALGASGDQTSSLKKAVLTQAQAEVPVAKPPEAPANNGLLHLTGTAISSTLKGAWEPLAGGLQFTEQVANAATLSLPGVHKAYFNPENLSPGQEPAPTKYSADWYVSNVFENVGKLPWYYMAGKAMSKVPGFKDGPGLASEAQMLGLNVKSASASGFIVGALTPTNVEADTTLTASLKERGIQATIGAGQMAMVTVGTHMLGKGVTAGEKLLAGGKETVVTEQALLGVAEVTQRTALQATTQTALKFAKNGAIGGIGAIPAGLAAGYANAKIHGTEFDPTENVVATMTVGFGLAGFSGAKSELAKAPARETAAPSFEGSAPDVANSPISARARARMQDLADKARAAFTGGTLSDRGLAFNSNEGIPDGGDKGAPKPAKDATVKGPEVPGTEKPGTEKPKAERPADAPGEPGTESGPKPDPIPKTFKHKFETPEAKAAYEGVFKSLMKASTKTGTEADEAAFVKEAAEHPWTVRQIREHLTREKVDSEHVAKLLDRADRVITDNAIITERVPRIGQESFRQGYDLLRSISEAQKPRQMNDGRQALKEFIVNSDDVLASRDQLRSAAEKLGGERLRDEFDKAFNKRYEIGFVHQLSTDQASFPGARNQFVEIRATEADRFNAIIIQARMVAEAHTNSAPEVKTASGKVLEAKSTPEGRYVRLKQISEGLDPELKSSLVNYARKTNDLRFRALINDIVADPKGEDLPNTPIRLSYNPALEPQWDQVHNQLSAHPESAKPGEAPSATEVAKYRESVFNALNRSDPAVLDLVKQYARQTTNSYEASALDYYFGIDRLAAFDSVKASKVDAAQTIENRNSFIPKPVAPPPLDLEAGTMKSGNGYLDRIIDRLGDKDAPRARPYNGSQSVDVLLKEADQSFTDNGVTRGKFSNRSDGLVKVITQPDNASGLIGGKHSTAYFENNPEGVLQIDDYADGTRWVMQHPAGEPESRTAYFANGTEYTYFSPEVWSVTFPNDNYIYSFPEGTGNVAREINENGKVTQVLRDGTTEVVAEAPDPNGVNAESTVAGLLESMRRSNSEKGRISAAEALKNQTGSMDDAQFKNWLDFIREVPEGPEARPAYLKMNGLRGLHKMFESGILDDPAVQKSLKDFLAVPAEGQIKFGYPKAMQDIDTADLSPQMLNDIRDRYTTKAPDGTTVYADNLPQELRSYFETNKRFEFKDKFDNDLPSLGKDNMAARLAALPELAAFKPETAAKLLELGAADPRALSDVMKRINDPRNDNPQMRTLLSETIPNADDIHTVKVLLDSIEAARRAYKPEQAEIRESNERNALKAVTRLTGSIDQDHNLGDIVKGLIGAKSGGPKGKEPETSRMAGSLELKPRTKVDWNAQAMEDPDLAIAIAGLQAGSPEAPLSTTPVDPLTDAARLSTENLDALTGNTEAVALPGATTEKVEAPAGSQEQTALVEAGKEGDHVAPVEQVAPIEPIVPTTESLIEKLNSDAPSRVRIAAADALKSQLSTMDDAQFHEWLQFVRQESTEAPIRPNYMRMSGMRGLGDLLDSDAMNDPQVARSLRDYLTAPEPGEFKLAYPEVLKDMTIETMPHALVNDIRDRFSSKGPDGLVFQDDVPQDVRDYLNTHERFKVTDNKGRRLPDLAPDTLNNRITLSSQLGQFAPETAAHLLELGAKDPRAMADVIRLMKEPRNDNRNMQTILAETIPNADDIYTLKLFLESVDAARWAFSPDRATERATNQDTAMKALSHLTGDNAQDKRLSKEVEAVIRAKAYIPNPRPSRLPENLQLRARTKVDPNAVPAPIEPPQQTVVVPVEAAQPGGQTQFAPEQLQAPAPGQIEAAPIEPQQVVPPIEQASTLTAPPASVEPIEPTQPVIAVNPAQVTALPAVELALEQAERAKARDVGQRGDDASDGDSGIRTGGSRIDRFNARQKKAQRPSGDQPGSQTGGKPFKPTRTVSSFADLGRLDFGGATDGDDVGSKGRNTEKHDRKEQSRQRDAAKRDRRDDSDD